jgi:hypothetical protein
MTLQDTLRETLKAVPDGVAAGYVDLTTGALLGISATEKKPQEFLNAMASAVAELFEAPLFKMIDKIWSDDLTEEDLGKDGFGEILLFGKEYTTLLKRCEKHERHAVIYVSRKETPPGILLMGVRKSLPAVEESV